MPHTKVIIKCRPFYLRPYFHSQKEDCPDNIRRTYMPCYFLICRIWKKENNCLRASQFLSLFGRKWAPTINWWYNWKFSFKSCPNVTTSDTKALYSPTCFEGLNIRLSQFVQNLRKKAGQYSRRLRHTIADCVSLRNPFFMLEIYKVFCDQGQKFIVFHLTQVELNELLILCLGASFIISSFPIT